MGDTRTEKRPQRRGLAGKRIYKANYRGATPKQVAEAMLRYRPDGKERDDGKQE